MDTNVTLDIGKNSQELLEKLASSLGTSVDKIYPYYVKQSVIEGWPVMIVCVVVGLVFSICQALLIKRAIKKSPEYDGEVHIGFTLMGGLVCLLAIFGFTNSLSKIWNPEYHAIHNIIEDASKLIGK